MTTSVQTALSLQSPNGDIELSVNVRDFEGHRNSLVYNVLYKGRTILAESRLGFVLHESPLNDQFEIESIENYCDDNTWKPVCGERSLIRDHYNAATIIVRSDAIPSYRLDVTFRLYDAGVAFCFKFRGEDTNSQIRIVKEATEFRFLADHLTWAAYRAQGVYRKTTLSQIKPGAERPLTIKIDQKTYVALAEARLVDYARMKLAPLVGARHVLISRLSSSVRAAMPFRLPFTTPWRVIMVAESPGQLLESNDLFLNLNEPCAIEQTSWIKPGKVIREVTLTTAGGKACIDFAARRNLQYVEFDAGWYGDEYNDESDATSVSVDPKRSPGPLDLEEVIGYAEKRGIGIILYVNRRALERQLDTVLPLYKKWGVKGIKFGFVQVGSREWTAWLHEAIRKAAGYQLMVDVHDEYRPTGYSRTFPNLMTQEGIRGDEESPCNSVTLTILFSRMLAGAGDHTVCYFDDRVDRMASHAYQMAKAVCLYSPWQFLYWYDRPADSPHRIAGAGGKHPVISDEPELEFFDVLPTVWDDTKVLQGEIGEYAVIARRSAQQWFVGCMNANAMRRLRISLDFLEEDLTYVAHIYSDDKTLDTLTCIKIDRVLVDCKAVIESALTAKGGQAMRLVPAASSDSYPEYDAGTKADAHRQGVT